jgi:hypothetical protein
LRQHIIIIATIITTITPLKPFGDLTIWPAYRASVNTRDWPSKSQLRY